MGESGAFERFVEHYRPKIFNYGWQICGQPQDAEDIAQETLLQIFQHADQLREPEYLRAWVFRIAKNAWLMRKRKSVFAPEYELPLDELSRSSEVTDASRLPDEEMQWDEVRAVLHRLIADLPPAYRAVVLLRDIEEFSTQETAQILDLTPDVVKTRLHRAHAAMRPKLDCYLHNRCLDVDSFANPAPLSEAAWEELRAAPAGWVQDSECIAAPSGASQHTPCKLRPANTTLARGCTSACAA